MALTGLQRIVLQRYRGYRSKPPTFLGLLRQSWQAEVILIAASVFGVWYASRSHLYGATCFWVPWRVVPAPSGAYSKSGPRSFKS